MKWLERSLGLIAAFALGVMVTRAVYEDGWRVALIALALTAVLVVGLRYAGSALRRARKARR